MEDAEEGKLPAGRSVSRREYREREGGEYRYCNLTLAGC